MNNDNYEGMVLGDFYHWSRNTSGSLAINQNKESQMA